MITTAGYIFISVVCVMFYLAGVMTGIKVGVNLQ